MKTLVVFYSRTNTTKKVAEVLAQKLDADLERITSSKNYLGVFGYLAAGREGMKKIPARIEQAIKDPAAYDLVILATPFWAGKMSSPMRAYLMQQKNKIKQAAFICVRGGSDTQNVFNEMAELCGRQPIATLPLFTKEVAGNDFEKQLEDFAANLK